MTNTQHTFTPGPWEIVNEDWESISIQAAKHNSLQVTVDNAYAIHEGEPGKEDLVKKGMAYAEANARLIAAAPELLEALEQGLELIGLYEGTDADYARVAGIARAAIAKSTSN